MAFAVAPEMSFDFIQYKDLLVLRVDLARNVATIQVFFLFRSLLIQTMAYSWRDDASISTLDSK